MTNAKGKYDLEERLIRFAIMISEVAEALPHTRLGNQIGNQMIRSGTSPALNYAEVKAAESVKDFIHKCSIILKELRETYVCLKIIARKPLVSNKSVYENVLLENNEPIAIFVKSIQTAKRNKLSA